MSINAVAWALGQSGLSPSGKLTLVVIAESANMHRNHVCDYLNQATIAERASLSVDTLQRRVKELVDLDLLYIVKRRANDGSVAKNYYVVLFDDAARQHAAANGWAPHGETAGCGGEADCSEERTEEKGAHASHAADCGMGHAANETEPCRKSNGAMPQLCGTAIQGRTGIDRNLPDSPPPSPDQGLGERMGGGGASRSENGTRVQNVDATRLERWASFQHIWPWAEDEFPADARSEFLQLSDKDQEAAIAAVPGYIAACRKRVTKALNHGIPHAKKWLRGENWTIAKARSVESAASLGGAPFTVREGSPQAAAWARYETAMYGAPRLKFIPSRLGRICTRPTEWPPSLKAGEGARDGPAQGAA